MTKHFVGLILFTFIVGTSAVIAGLFNAVIPSEKTVTVKKTYNVYKKKRHCYKRTPRVVEVSKSLISADVQQAVFDPSTGQLTTTFKFKKANTYGKKVLNLHFFVSDKYGTRYLKTDRVFVPVKDNFMISSYDWLSNLTSRENLYVMSEVSTKSKWTVTPVFDRSKAMPILVKATN